MITLVQFDVPVVGTSLTNVTVTGSPQLSDDATTPGSGGVTNAKHWVLEGGGGQKTPGGVVSFPVMSCVQVVWLPHESVARYVRVITLLQLDAPFVAMSPTWITRTRPPQLSDAGIKPVVDSCYPLSELPAALDHFDRGAFGKIVVTVAA